METLKKYLRLAKIDQKDLLEILDIKSLSTINLKLNGKSYITTREAKLIKDLINKKLNTNLTIEEIFN